MKILLCAIAITLVSCTGTQGPTGPMGPKGDTGDDAKTSDVMYTKTGILSYSDTTDGGNWDISVFYSYKTLTQCYVRMNESQMWQPCDFFLGSYYVRILDRSPAQAGYEYLIVCIKN